METINWTLTVQVSGGPKASASQAIEVSAYEVVDAIIPKKAGSDTVMVKVEVQAGHLADIKFLFIWLTDAAKYGSKVSYVIGAEEVDPDSRKISSRMHQNPSP